MHLEARTFSIESAQNYEHRFQFLNVIEIKQATLCKTLSKFYSQHNITDRLHKINISDKKQLF